MHQAQRRLFHCWEEKVDKDITHTASLKPQHMGRLMQWRILLDKNSYIDIIQNKEKVCGYAKVVYISLVQEEAAYYFCGCENQYRCRAKPSAQLYKPHPRPNGSKDPFQHYLHA